MTTLPRRRFHPLVPVAILVAAVLATFLQPTDAHAAGRIINGSAVDTATYASRWSSIVSIVARAEDDVRKGQFCAGTLVAPRLVVTAAHCVADSSRLLVLQDVARDVRYNNARAVNPRSLQVVVGRRVLGIRDGQRMDVSQIQVHPKYDPETSQYDIAVLRLAATPASTLGASPVRPVAEGEDAIWGAGAGKVANATDGPWAAGWGYRSDPYADLEFFTGASAHKPHHRPTKPSERVATRSARSSIANTLEQTTLTVRSDTACDTGGAGDGTGYGRVFDAATMFCAGTLDTTDANDENATTNGVDTCYGDSGGPVLASTGTSLRLVGVVSFGETCAGRSTYGVYTRVAAMRPFLASANPTAPVKVTSKPRTSGRARVGRVLRCSPGAWSGPGKIRYSYRWITTADYETASESSFYVADEIYKRLPKSGNTRTYRVRARDSGTKVGCLVIASNGTLTAAENSKLVKVPGKPPVDPEDEGSDGPSDGLLEFLFG